MLVVATLNAVDESLPEGRVAVEAAEQLIERHLRHQRAGLDAGIHAVTHARRGHREGSGHGDRVLTRCDDSGL